jgi:hypothetical protein
MSSQRDALGRGGRCSGSRDVKRAATDGNLKTDGKGIVIGDFLHDPPNRSPA